MTTLLRQRILPSMTRSMNVLHPRIISTPKIRFYSSSSSSSSSTKKSNNTTPTAPQKELHFVHVNNIHPRDLAQSAFYALDRPLLTFGDQVQQAFEYGQNQQVWEEDEDGDEHAGSNTNTTPLNNPLSPYLRSSPFHPTQSTISMTTAESEYVANRFLSEIGLKFKQEQLSNDQNDQKKTAMEPKINNVNQQGQSDEMNSEAEDNTLYTTNIIQKRRLKMNKHKHKKLRKRTRALRRRQGKI